MGKSQGVTTAAARAQLTSGPAAERVIRVRGTSQRVLPRVLRLGALLRGGGGLLLRLCDAEACGTRAAGTWRATGTRTRHTCSGHSAGGGIDR